MNRWADYVAGYGEVGHAISDVIASSGVCLQILDRAKGYDVLKEPPADCMKVLHICFPWSKEFYDSVEAHIHRIKPDLVIIHSTVLPENSPGYLNAVYSPVRGQHDNLKEDIIHYMKYIAGKDIGTVELARMRLDDAGLKVKNLGDKVSTLEWAKHLSNTLYYHWILAYRQLVHQWCRELELDEEALWSFTEELHKRTGVQYPARFDPSGIGGHCVIQNSQMLISSPYLPDSMKSVLGLMLEINDEVKSPRGEKVGRKE